MLYLNPCDFTLVKGLYSKKWKRFFWIFKKGICIIQLFLYSFGKIVWISIVIEL